MAIFSLVFVFSLAASAQGVSLTSIDGGRVDVQARKDKIVVLAIGASWLPLSNQQAVFANKLAKKYAGRDVEIYFVMTDSTAPKSKNYASNEDLQSFAARNKLNMTILRDSDGVNTLKKFGIDQIPSFVILGKDGKPATEAFGGIDPKTDISVSIAQQIDRIL
ncbi:MAG: TlpA family protein disulfide reductase [Acidobacteriota bacterium]|nr:TlpA family protein disulfide reductase [Acidobacteriota bacterium]